MKGVSLLVSGLKDSHSRAALDVEGVGSDPRSSWQPSVTMRWGQP